MGLLEQAARSMATKVLKTRRIRVFSGDVKRTRMFSKGAGSARPAYKPLACLSSCHVSSLVMDKPTPTIPSVSDMLRDWQPREPVYCIHPHVYRETAQDVSAGLSGTRPVRGQGQRRPGRGADSAPGGGRSISTALHWPRSRWCAACARRRPVTSWCRLRRVAMPARRSGTTACGISWSITPDRLDSLGRKSTTGAAWSSPGWPSAMLPP